VFGSKREKRRSNVLSKFAPTNLVLLERKKSEYVERDLVQMSNLIDSFLISTKSQLEIKVQIRTRPLFQVDLMDKTLREIMKKKTTKIMYSLILKGRKH
jgi:hypothetical protein